MHEEYAINEQRHYPRREVNHIALLRVSDLLQGRGHAKNISRGGMLLQTSNLFSNIRSSKIHSRIGSPIKVVFATEPITVYGRIVRINVRKGEVAIVLKEINNTEAWENMCAGQD